jgi:hypothetical protein
MVAAIVAVHGDRAEDSIARVSASPADKATGGPRWPWWLVWALAVAAVARVAWLSDKPLWRDEAWVAVMARETGDGVPFSPRPVPVGFLLLSALALRLPVLAPEVSLRLLPLAAGLATVALLPVLARSLQGSPATAATAAWIAAGMPLLVYYSRELKPYALDALLAVAVPWLAWRALGEADAPGAPRERALLAAVLAAAPWITFGSVFPIAATLAWAAGRAGRAPQTRRAFAVLALVYLISFAAAYALVLRDQAAAPRLLRSWQPDIAWLRERGWAVGVQRASRLYAAVALRSTFPGVWPVAAALAAVGAWTWPARGRAFLVAQVAGCGAFAVAAALMGGYLVGEGRLLLFAAPALALLVAGGLATVAAAAGERLRRPLGGAAPAAAAVLALVWTWQELAWRIRPYRNDVAQYFRYDILHDVDPLIGEAARRAGRGDPVITSRYSGEQFRFYARGRLPQTFVCTRANCLDEGPPMRAWLDGVKDRGFMILLEEEDRPWRREAVRRAGFDVEEAAAARGARLWEIRRRPSAGTVAR